MSEHSIRPEEHDYDWVVVGSGFGGSVSALRLAQRGYRVAVLETGRRWADDDFATSAWQLHKYLWAPRLGLRGILRLSVLQHVSIASGVGVGGGSLSYANTLLVPDRPFFDHPQWAGLRDWVAELAPHYAEARRMLGATTYDEDDPADRLLHDLARRRGVGDGYRKADVGVFLGTPGLTVPDPFLGGQGPDRTGCTRCGDCMLGCRVGAKNTLVKNYLHLAEQLGVTVLAEHEVTSVRPLDGERGATGYRIEARLRRRRTRTLTVGHVVLSAGALGTTRLLLRLREQGDLPRLSPTLGQRFRTNGEYVPAVRLPRDPDPAVQRRVSITSDVRLDEHTHLQTLIYGDHAQMMTNQLTFLTRPGATWRRVLSWLAQSVRRPGRVLDGFRGGSRRSVMLLFMQNLSNGLRLVAETDRRGRLRIRSQQDPAEPVPAHLPLAHEVARDLAQQSGGVAQGQLMDSLASIGMTAHPLGGAVIGADAEHGVVDADQHVFGYEHLMVCDGSVVPANLATNPSLTITALTELAMSRVPAATSTTATPVPS